jgi:hypothetical protein
MQPKESFPRDSLNSPLPTPILLRAFRRCCRALGQIVVLIMARIGIPGHAKVPRPEPAWISGLTCAIRSPWVLRTGVNSIVPVALSLTCVANKTSIWYLGMNALLSCYSRSW